MNEKLESLKKQLDSQMFRRDQKEGVTPWIVSEAFHLGATIVTEPPVEQPCGGTCSLIHGVSIVDQLKVIGEEIMIFLYKCSNLISNEGIKNEIMDSLPEENKKGVERLKKLAKTEMPILIRPDIIIEQSSELKFEKLWIPEIDLQPAGLGILQVMQEIYEPQNPSIAQVWAEMVDQPVVLSIPDFKFHHPEHKYFMDKVNHFAGKEMIKMIPIEQWHSLGDYEGFIFKSCCTMSLITEKYPSFIPEKAVIVPNDILDWKGWLALSGKEDVLQKQRLTQRIPETHLLPLKAGDKNYETCKRKELIDLSKKERGKWVIKPVHSWGAKGFKTGDEINSNAWNQQILGLPDRSVSQGMLLQKKIESIRYKTDGITPEGKIVNLDNLRIRISPFYIMWKGRIKLAGTLITLRASDKVHGASDSVITLLSN